MARPPSDEAFTELVVASWPSLYRTAYLAGSTTFVRDAGEAFES